MIILSVNVPNVAAILAQNYTQIQLLKSVNQSASGTYNPLGGAVVALQAGVTTYSLTDVGGGYGDWYATAYATALNVLSAPGQPQPGYLSDLCNTTRDLLGVTTNEVTDAQIQGFTYLPTALGRVRQRLTTFDAVVAAGGDLSNLALGALAHLIAALLCPRMTVAVVDSEQFDKYKYQRNRQMDWTATQTELFAQYEILISEAASEHASVRTLYVPGVVLAGPTRSGQDTSAGLVFLEDEDSPYTTNIGGETEGQGDDA